MGVQVCRKNNLNVYISYDLAGAALTKPKEDTGCNDRL
jgi:hypothetical protein